MSDINDSAIEKQDDLIGASMDVRYRKIISIVKSSGCTADEMVKGLEFIGAALRAQKADAVGNQSLGKP